MASRGLGRKLNSDTDMSGILSLCLVSSTGVAFIFTTLLPLGPDIPSYQHEVLSITRKLSLSALVVIIIVQLLRFIKNKEKYHENRTVFWPMRCPHCAFIFGKPARESTYTSSDSRRLNSSGFVLYENPVFQSPRLRTGRPNSPQAPPSTCPSDPQVSVNYSSPAFDPPELNHQDSSTNWLDTHIHSSAESRLLPFPRNNNLYCKRKKSFLNIFGVLLIFALISVPLTLAASIICIFKGENSHKIGMVSSSIQCIVLITLIPVSMQFAVNYYDAVFARTIDNVFTMVIFTSGAVCISVFKIAIPINSLLKSPFSRPGGCEVNGTLAKVENRAILMLTPFNAECAIVALCILWYMWASFVRRDSLRQDSTHMPQRDIFRGDSCVAHFKKFLQYCRGCKGRRRPFTNTFLHPSVRNLQKFLSKAWSISITFSVVIFIVILYIEVDDPFEQNGHYREIVLWSIDFVFILPFFMLYMHQSYVSRHSQETFAPITPRKMEVHDGLLLLCSCGIFCQCIMRLAAGSGLLLGDPPEPPLPHYKALAIYAIIYSLTIILMIWQMTAFLLQVQGIRMENLCEIKWVLVCLIYISVANAVQWLSESVTMNRWHVQCAFYGKTAGSVVGTLLHPFATLYGLHAAMVSYEAYKSILQETRDLYTPVAELELLESH